MITDEPWNSLNRSKDTQIRGIASVSLIELLLLDYIKLIIGRIEI